jgi:branched-subunit amino acid aminotransferase/4-amino-4-deoxychorismate lyase
VADADNVPDPGLGVFDTLLVRRGRAVDLGAHVDRLARSVRELYDVPVDAAVLAGRMQANAEPLGTARVRTSYEPASGEWEIEMRRIAEPGLDRCTLTRRRIAGGLGPHKWVDRRLVADPGDADDVLLVDESDGLLECGAANVFLVADGVVVTPPLDGRILPGTVRARVLALLRSHDVEAAEQPVTLTALAGAAEVFTTSSIRGVQPVISCAGLATWPVGPTTSWLRERLGTAG